MLIRIRYFKTLIYGGYLILAILAVEAKRANILVRQYYLQSLSEVKIKRSI